MAKLTCPRRVLELGTGLGMTTLHILKELKPDAVMDTVEKDEKLIAYAKEIIFKHGGSEKVRFYCEDGESFILRARENQAKYDFIFADTWPGKYALLEETLSLLAPNGLYVIDDMLPNSNWPKGHDKKVKYLLNDLYGRNDFIFSCFSIGTGIGIAQKKE